jgi:hypothetical protein
MRRASSTRQDFWRHSPPKGPLRRAFGVSGETSEARFRLPSVSRLSEDHRHASRPRCELTPEEYDARQKAQQIFDDAWENGITTWAEWAEVLLALRVLEETDSPEEREYRRRCERKLKRGAEHARLKPAHRRSTGEHVLAAYADVRRRPRMHGQHRRAPGRQPVRRTGSRRTSAPTRGPPSDDPDDPDPPALARSRPAAGAVAPAGFGEVGVDG